MIARRGEVRGAGPLFELLAATAAANVTGAIHFPPAATLYLVEGHLYGAHRRGDPDLVSLLVAAGALTTSEAGQLRRRGELMLSQDTRVARAEVGLDRPACHAAIRRLVEDVVVELALLGESSYQFDPYGVHPLNVVASWPVAEVVAPARLALARRLGSQPPPDPPRRPQAHPGRPPLPPPGTTLRASAPGSAAGGVAGGAAIRRRDEPQEDGDEDPPRKAALRRLIGAIRRL